MNINKVVLGDENVILDLSNDTIVSSGYLKAGEICHDATGSQITGTSEWYADRSKPTIYKSPLCNGPFDTDIQYNSNVLAHIKRRGDATSSTTKTITGDLNNKFTYWEEQEDDWTYTDTTEKVVTTLACYVYGGSYDVRFDEPVDTKYREITPITKTYTYKYTTKYRNYTEAGTASWTSKTMTFTIPVSMIPIYNDNNQMTGIRYYWDDTSWQTIATRTVGPASSISYWGFETEWVSDTATPTADITYTLEERTPAVQYEIPIDSPNPLYRDSTYYYVYNDYIRFYIDTDNAFKASNSVNTITISAAQTYYATYGIYIMKIIYLSNNAILLMWTYQTSATQLGNVNWKILDFDTTGQLHQTANRALIPSAGHKLVGDGISGYTYSGNIFKYNFRDGEWTIGLNYIRYSYNASQECKQQLGFGGVIGAFVTASASNRIDFQRTTVSRLVQFSPSANPSLEENEEIWFNETHGNILIFNYYKYKADVESIYSGSTYIFGFTTSDLGLSPMRLASPSGQIEDFYFNASTCLGKLEDGTFVFFLGGSLSIYDCRYVASNNASTWIKIGEIKYSQVRNTNNLRLLKGGVFIELNEDYPRIYQLMPYKQTSFSDAYKYELQYVGDYTLVTLPNTDPHYYITDNTNTIYGYYARPIGRFSDLQEGIGGAKL